MSERLRNLGIVPFFIQQLPDTCVFDVHLGRVLSVQRCRSTVACESGERVVALTPALRESPALDRPVVGDWVVLDDSLSRIEKVLERKSLFRRLGAGSKNEIQPIAANIDILFIVTSCNEEFKESRLERYLALCAEAGATPVIVLTKVDLAADPDIFVRRASSVKAGIPIESANTLDPATLDGVRAWIDSSSTVALVGSSGVGKSTLLNTLAANPLAATREVREQDKKGRHTTTHRELHILPSGGLLIDVPGMRELRVAGLDQSIGAVFDDIQSLEAQCRFADCRHETEPGCAVVRAIQESAIDPRRLANYRKLTRENALATATLAEKRSRGREFARMVKAGKRMKQKKAET